MGKHFNEATRVQMPALVHLTRLGYKYFGKISEEMANTVYDPATNILIDEFKKQFDKLNPDRAGEGLQVLQLIRQELDNDDIGRAFYKRLVTTSPYRLIDFENIANNSFYFTAEFTCKNGQDEFRPDITLFINGLPLVFIEVKKPNNKGGIIAESERMNHQRFPNKKFKRFINITQLMIFSNNMEYDAEGGIVPIQGAFYCTAAKEQAPFNCFREENPTNENVAPFIKDYPYASVEAAVEQRILTDYNCQVIHTAPEYQTNLNVNTPTNRIITSMCSPGRLLFILKYGIAYVNITFEEDGDLKTIEQKHIMRYQQMFAALAIRDQLAQGVTSGVVWHTQGSGKTALSYYLNAVLTDYYAKQDKVAKFYFIVDRLDLLEQASQEFTARGLDVKTANSRKELMEQFRSNQSLEGNTGNLEITVVNIQRFAEDKEKIELPDYAINIQRIFIIDEAHRGYKPEGSFLANLLDADKNSVKIALTGTPLLKEERASWKVFGNYLHTYYYDKSIQDGYTLKIMREDIATSYRETLSQIYDNLETLVLQKEIKKSQIIEHPKYVRELCRYTINDLNRFRKIHGDETLGGMIICETSEQARRIYENFANVQEEINETLPSGEKLRLVPGLILHDSDDKETRKNIVTAFKKNMTVDILIVFNMLLTGFDAPRLKRLYVCRKLKDHNLLQAITRVNRPYKDNKYGYIIDFADIKRNFDETNEAYLRELNRFNDPEELDGESLPGTLEKVLENPEDILDSLKEVKRVLFNYTTDNLEEFSSEISTIEDKKELLELKKVLVAARDGCNIARSFGDDELKAAINAIDLPNISEMINEIQRCINTINMKEAIEQSDDNQQLINEAMLDIEFKFESIGEEELRMISGGMELQELWNKAIRAFTENTDPADPEYITLHEAMLKRFKEHGFKVDSIDEYEAHTKALEEIIDKLKAIAQKNKILAHKYKDDVKFARVHKRIREENKKREAIYTPPIIATDEVAIFDMLFGVKVSIDKMIYDRNDILKKDAYFEQSVLQQLTLRMNESGLAGSREDRLFIQQHIAKEYLEQYKETYLTI